MKAKTPSFKRKLRSKFSDKRSRSVSSIHHLKEDTIFGMFFLLFLFKKPFYPSYTYIFIAKTICWKRKLSYIGFYLHSFFCWLITDVLVERNIMKRILVLLHLITML
jgi:hypothetical protein